MTQAEQLATFVQRSSYGDLMKDARQQLKIRTLDALGCAIGAVHSEPIRMVHALMEDFGGAPLCTLAGGERNAPDRTTFYNNALVRYLNFNDSYQAKGETLPSALPAAAPVQDREPSPALQIIGKMKNTLEGRIIGILVADGSDGAVINELRKAAADAGAKVTIVAPKVGGATLADGSILGAGGRLAGTPSGMFDAFAVVLSSEGAKLLTRDSAAIEFMHDAFAHLKAIAVDKGGQELLLKANMGKDKGVVDLSDIADFISAAKTRQWDREPSVRTLA
jgi:hypothetical protein